MKSDTVLGHVALTLTTQRENLATEALGYILRTSPAASRGFIKYIRPILQEGPEDLYFETQRGGLNQGIPDMTCYDSEWRPRVIVENKFWATLTKNQPDTYIQKLPERIASMVLFVVPKDRLELIWNELIEKRETQVSNLPTFTTMKVVDIGNQHYLAATSWDDLLEALSAEVTQDGETDCHNDIAQLQGMCKMMEKVAFLPLSNDELTNPDVARRVVNYSDLAIDIRDEAVKQKLCSRDNVRATNYKHGSGARIRIGTYALWIGFDAMSWLRLGISPIWLYFYPPPQNLTPEIREKLLRPHADSIQPSFDSYNGLLVPINLLIGVEKQRIIEDAVKQIGKLVNVLSVLEPSKIDPDQNPSDHLDEVEGKPCSREDYASDVEWEAARERFTDSSGWVVVTAAPEKAE